MFGFIRRLLCKPRHYLPADMVLWNSPYEAYPTNVERLLHENDYMYAVLGTGEIMRYDGKEWTPAPSHRTRCRRCKKLLEPHVCI